MKKILLRILWLIPIPFICLLVCPLLVLSLIAKGIAWITTGSVHELTFKLWEYPPLTWVNKYLGLFSK